MLFSVNHFPQRFFSCWIIFCLSYSANNNTVHNIHIHRTVQCTTQAQVKISTFECPHLTLRNSGMRNTKKKNCNVATQFSGVAMCLRGMCLCVFVRVECAASTSLFYPRKEKSFFNFLDEATLKINDENLLNGFTIYLMPLFVFVSFSFWL